LSTLRMPGRKLGATASRLVTARWWPETGGDVALHD